MTKICFWENKLFLALKRQKIYSSDTSCVTYLDIVIFWFKIHSFTLKFSNGLIDFQILSFGFSLLMTSSRLSARPGPARTVSPSHVFGIMVRGMGEVVDFLVVNRGTDSFRYPLSNIKSDDSKALRVKNYV